MPDDGKKPAASVAVGADTRNAHQRLLDVMREVDYVQKDRPIGTGSNSYKVVTHDAVTAKVRPALVKNGLVYYPQNLLHTQNGNRTEITVDIVFVNAANPTDKIAVPSLGYGVDGQDKGPGKALSYAVKMALLKALGLETGEDADDNTNVDHKPDAKPAEVDPMKVKNAPGVSEARAWLRDHFKDLNACESADEFLTHLATQAARWAKICGVYPNLYTGVDGSGLKGEAQKLATIYECRQEFDKFVKQIEAQAAELQTPKQAAQ